MVERFPKEETEQVRILLKPHIAPPLPFVVVGGAPERGRISLQSNSLQSSVSQVKTQDLSFIPIDCGLRTEDCQLILCIYAFKKS